jgi:hypothetical protein
MVKYRVCWYCPECHATEKAIGRERVIDTNWFNLVNKKCWPLP